MKTEITLRGVAKEQEADLRAYVQEQLVKITGELEQDPRALYLEVMVDEHDLHAHHRVAVHIKYGDALLIVDHQGRDLRQEIALVIEKAQERLHREKERRAKRKQDGQ